MRYDLGIFFPKKKMSYVYKRILYLLTYAKQKL